MIVLALDTALAACSVTVVEDGRALAARSEPMLRGHQERLAPLVAEVMAEAGVGFPRLNRIGVTVGPGSFTGLRVGLAFAKGLSVALSIPCVGIGTLEALAASASDQDFVAAVIDARRDKFYLQVFAKGRPLVAPDALEPAVAAARLAELWSGGPAVLVGPGAALLEGVIAGARVNSRDSADPVVLARLAAAAAAPAPAHRPRPLYLRGADARTIAERAADRA